MRVNAAVRFLERVVPGRGRRPTADRARPSRWLDQILQDVRDAARSLRRAPGFSATAITVLALGMGLNVTMFGTINATLVRPLPYPNAQELVSLDEGHSRGRTKIALANFADWQERQRVFTSLAAYRFTQVALSGTGEAERVPAVLATSDLFRVLGVSPAVGRAFTPSDAAPGAPPVVVVGDELWRRRYDARALVGQTIRVDGVPTTVIGIMPPGFAFPVRQQMWLPAPVDRTLANRSNHGWWGIARLAAGQTLTTARAEMRRLAGQLAQEYPETNHDDVYMAAPLRDETVGLDLRRALLFGMAAVGLVLLVACANVANLLLARGSARDRELALRGALGASRGRLVRQLLCESLVLGACGTVVGLLVGRLGLTVVGGLLPENAPTWVRDLTIDPSVVAFAVVLLVVTSMASGLVPALRVSRTDLRQEIGGAAGFTHARRAGVLRSTLVVVEAALAMVLLVCAGSMTRGLLDLMAHEPGFRAEQVVTMEVALPESAYATRDSVRSFYAEFLDIVRTIPGVRRAGAASRLASQQSNWGLVVQPDRSVARSADRVPTSGVVVTPGYFETMEIAVIHGRTFTPRDGLPGTPGVAIVNRRFVEQHWTSGDPIGRRLRYMTGPGQYSDWLTVVGVVDDVLEGPGADPVTMYLPHGARRTMTLCVRTTSGPMTVVAPIRQRLAGLDSNLPLGRIRHMEAVVDELYWMPGLFARLFGGFAVLALVLAAVGAYGVVANAVACRTREIGIRTALGADARQIRRLVFRQGSIPMLVGTGIGVAAGLGTTRAMRSLLAGVSPTDPLVFGVVIGVMAAVAGLACYVPARRAGRVDPLVALRQD